LGSRVVEFGRLSDDDRAGTDNEDLQERTWRASISRVIVALKEGGITLRAECTVAKGFWAGKCRPELRLYTGRGPKFP
jgi:hypothetical protein